MTHQGARSEARLPGEFAEAQTLARVQSMIQMAYSVAVDPEKFPELISTWDEFVVQTGTQTNFALLTAHFEQAEQIADDPRLDNSRSLETILSLVAAPAVLVNDKGRFITGNQRGIEIVGTPERGAYLADHFEGAWQGCPDAPTLHFHFRTETTPQLLAASSRVSLPHDSSVIYLIRFEATAWVAAMSSILRDKYRLSEAEIEISRYLHQGQSAAEIAAERNRGLETVRSQIKSILSKTGCRKQTGLLQFLSHLQYIASNDTDPANAGALMLASRTGFFTATYEDEQGRKLCASLYGAPGGDPVIYLTSSTRPQETSEWQRAVSDANLRMIAIHRPGFLGSDPIPRSADLASYLAAGCAHFLDRERRPIVVAGHREGGIFAVQVAEVLSRRFTVQATCLISTGAPEPDISGFENAPDTFRRSMLATRTMPSALRLGYRAARRVFLAGQAGEKQIIGYSLKDSTVDQTLLRDPQFWDIARENMLYCFENTDQIVDDFTLWTSNWGQKVTQPDVAVAPWVFVQGQSHDFLRPDWVQSYCRQNPSCHLHLIPQTSQLMIYQRTAEVVQIISDQFRS